MRTLLRSSSAAMLATVMVAGAAVATSGPAPQPGVQIPGVEAVRLRLVTPPSVYAGMTQHVVLRLENRWHEPVRSAGNTFIATVRLPRGFRIVGDPQGGVIVDPARVDFRLFGEVPKGVSRFVVRMRAGSLTTSALFGWQLDAPYGVDKSYTRSVRVVAR